MSRLLAVAIAVILTGCSAPEPTWVPDPAPPAVQLDVEPAPTTTPHPAPAGKSAAPQAATPPRLSDPAQSPSTPPPTSKATPAPVPARGLIGAPASAPAPVKATPATPAAPPSSPTPSRAPNPCATVVLLPGSPPIDRSNYKCDGPLPVIDCRTPQRAHPTCPNHPSRNTPTPTSTNPPDAPTTGTGPNI